MQSARPAFSQHLLRAATKGNCLGQLRSLGACSWGKPGFDDQELSESLNTCVDWEKEAAISHPAWGLFALAQMSPTLKAEPKS